MSYFCVVFAVLSFEEQVFLMFVSPVSSFAFVAVLLASWGTCSLTAQEAGSMNSTCRQGSAFSEGLGEHLFRLFLSFGGCWQSLAVQFNWLTQFKSKQSAFHPQNSCPYHVQNTFTPSQHPREAWPLPASTLSLISQQNFSTQNFPNLIL